MKISTSASDAYNESDFLRRTWRISCGMRCCLALALFFGASVAARANPVIHSWPFGEGQAVRSDRYAVFVSTGHGTERPVDVVMSTALHEGDYRAKELAGRTFSFAAVDIDPSAGPLNFRVVKLRGPSATSVEVQPSRLNLRPELLDGREVRFAVPQGPAYVSVCFEGPESRTPAAKWIKHMFCLFVGTPEHDRPVPGTDGAVAYGPRVDSEKLRSARIILFESGYHDLRGFVGKSGPVRDGVLQLASGQGAYLSSGAFVDGLISTSNPAKDVGQSLRGRGILSGRRFPWYGVSGYQGPRHQEIVRLGQKARFEGVVVMESPAHGLVSGNHSVAREVKYLGWHCNNDAIRFDPGSEVSGCFLRAVDDFFYAFELRVRDCVLWPGHNGAVLTFGWGGGPGDRTYHAGATTLERLDLIHPEWTALGNNNGLVAAQVGYDFKPHAYGRDCRTLIRDVRIDGDVPGLLNLKPRAGDVPAGYPPKVSAAALGHLRDITLEHISVRGIKGRGLIKGAISAVLDDERPFMVKDVRFIDLYVGGEPVDETNASRYFEIDAATTEGVRFETKARPGR